MHGIGVRLDLTLLYDLDGTATTYASGPGQLFNGNPGYSAPYPNVTQHPNSDWAMCFAPEKMVLVNTPQCGGTRIVSLLSAPLLLTAFMVMTLKTALWRYKTPWTIIVQCDFGRV